MLLKFVLLLGEDAGTAGIPFLPFCLSNSLFSGLGSACTTYPHLDEEGHLEYPGILQRSSVPLSS